jgi:hypothetical protein
MNHELNFAQPDVTLAKLRIRLMIMQLRKHTAEMLFMLFLTLRKDQDVVNEDHDKLVHLFHENRVHQVHEVSGGIGQAKRHNHILVRDLGVGRNQWQGSVQGTPIEKTRIKIGGTEEISGPRVACPSANKPQRQIYDALLTGSRGNHLPMVKTSRRGWALGHDQRCHAHNQPEEGRWMH